MQRYRNGKVILDTVMLIKLSFISLFENTRTILGINDFLQLELIDINCKQVSTGYS